MNQIRKYPINPQSVPYESIFKPAPYSFLPPTKPKNETLFILLIDFSLEYSSPDNQIKMSKNQAIFELAILNNRIIKFEIRSETHQFSIMFRINRKILRKAPLFLIKFQTVTKIQAKATKTLSIIFRRNSRTIHQL